MYTTYLEYQIGTFAKRRFIWRIDWSLFRKLGIELRYIIVTGLQKTLSTDKTQFRTISREYLQGWV